VSFTIVPTNWIVGTVVDLVGTVLKGLRGKQRKEKNKCVNSTHL